MFWEITDNYPVDLQLIQNHFKERDDCAKVQHINAM